MMDLDFKLSQINFFDFRLMRDYRQEMEFYIRQGATKPDLLMQPYFYDDFNFPSFQDKLKNTVVTFSMYDIEKQCYKILNKPACFQFISKKDADTTLYLDNCDLEDIPFLKYTFTKKQTKYTGHFKGEFQIKFLDDNSSLIVPNKNDLFIFIKESITDID